MRTHDAHMSFRFLETFYLFQALNDSVTENKGDGNTSRYQSVWKVLEELKEKTRRIENQGRIWNHFDDAIGENIVRNCCFKYNWSGNNQFIQKYFFLKKSKD